MKGTGQTDPPSVSNTSAGIRIKHREYITDITSSLLFNNLPFALNPGQIGTFPWLSTVAGAFQEYKFHGCVFEFISNCSDQMSSTSPAQGAVILATDYNAAHANFTTKVEMENSEFATSGKPAVNILHLIETESRQTIMTGHKYVRVGLNPPNTDIRMSDLGTFQIATDGMQAAFKVGQLHVSYDVEFFKPELAAPCVNEEAKVAHYQFSGVSQALPWNSPVQLFDTIGITFTGAAINFPPGSSATGFYAIACTELYSPGAVAVVSPVPILVNMTAVPSMATAVPYWDTPNIGVTSTKHATNNLYYKVINNALPASFKWCPYSSAADWIGDLLITQLPPTFL